MQIDQSGASSTKLGSLDSGSARNVNINIIRGGGGGGSGNRARAPRPPSPAQMARDAADKVSAMQSQVAQQMAHANDELHAQKQRADDLVKAQVRPASIFHSLYS
jgi:rare lipoprotein A (peptidoglycan hydrolase)